MVKNLPANAGDIRNAGMILRSGRCPGGGQPISVFLPGKSHGLRSLVSYIHGVAKKLDMNYQLNNIKYIYILYICYIHTKVIYVYVIVYI